MDFAGSPALNLATGYSWTSVHRPAHSFISFSAVLICVPSGGGRVFIAAAAVHAVPSITAGNGD
jgi:hypothetical protein